MARGSFGRTVARAAASGGSRSYRARPPALWYLLMVVVVVGGLGLIAYSRYEVQHPASAGLGPSANDTWYAALGIDICGTLEPNLPVSTNLSSTGLRTFGDGLIEAAPSVASTPKTFEGANATLGLFASNYSGFTLTSNEIQYPGKHQRLWKDGESCTGKLKGKASLVAKVWSSPSSKTATLISDPTKIHIANGEMITVAFVPSGASIPQPGSKSTLVQTISSKSSG